MPDGISTEEITPKEIIDKIIVSGEMADNFDPGSWCQDYQIKDNLIRSFKEIGENILHEELNPIKISFLNHIRNKKNH